MEKVYYDDITTCMVRAVGELTMAWYYREDMADTISTSRSYLAYMFAKQAVNLYTNPHCMTGDFFKEWEQTLTAYIDQLDVNECFSAAFDMVTKALNTFNGVIDMSVTNVEHAPWYYLYKTEPHVAESDVVKDEVEEEFVIDRSVMEEDAQEDLTEEFRTVAMEILTECMGLPKSGEESK